MASEIRVDKINSLSGVGTVTLSPTGVDIAGITTAATLKATTGIVTSLQVTGNTGIGTDTPTEKLAVKGHLVVGDDFLVNRPRIVLSAPNEGISTYRHLFGANLKVDSSGTFTTPTANISGGGWEYLAANSLSAHGTLTYLSAPDTNATSSTPLARLRIESDGKVGIATTNGTNYQLLTLSSDSAVARFERTDGAWAKIDIRAGTTAGNSYITFSDSAAGELGAINYEHNDETLKFETWNGSSRVERLCIEADGDVTISDGDLIIGTAGHGIDFSAQTASSATGATTGSEVLDHYEEGDWTPVLSFGGGTSGITYTARDGAYTRIGRQVTITFMVELSSKGSSTGQATITGLPFTVPDLISDTVVEASGSASYWNNIDPDLMWMGFSCETTGSGQLSFRHQPETGASDAVGALSSSEFTNTTNFRGTVIYFTS